MCGYVENKTLKVVNTLQCFLIASIYYDNKDVVYIVPVQQINADFLCDLTKQVIINVT